MAVVPVSSYSPFEPLSDAALLSLGSMEGLVEAPIRKKPKTSHWPGYAAAAGVAAAAYLIHYLPFAPFLVDAKRPISASIIAIVIAILLRNLDLVPSSTLAGCKQIVRKVIPAAIILTGAGLHFGQVASVGWDALLVTLIGMSVATASALWAGGKMGLGRKSALLIGTGTAVCGNSAIIAVAPLIGAEDEDVTLSVGTVSLLGLVLMFALPALGAILALSQKQFGVWAGAAIHAVPQVVAAGFTYGPDAGTLATLVKLGRVSLLAPFLVIVALCYRSSASQLSISRLIPPFIGGFVLLAVLNTLGLLPSLLFQASGLHPGSIIALGPSLVEVGHWLLTLAMAAVGLEVNLRLLLHVGTKAVLTGVAAMICLCLTTLMLIRLLL
jgi:uncharacterized integral membrane protein (TIGR00698 family)